MKKVIAIMLFCLVGCGPAELITEEPESEELVEVIEPGFLETDCGYAIGDQACDFALLDADEELWRLSDHIGDLVLIDLSAMWCGPCQQAATTAQSTQDEFEAEGFHYATVLIVDLQNDTVEIEDQVSWADIFGIENAPVLQGSRELLVSGGAAHGFPVESWPTFLLLDRTHTVIFGLRGFSESMIKDAIEENI